MRGHRRQKSEVGGRRSEGLGLRTEGGRQMSEVGKRQKIRREEGEKIKEQDDWMNRMDPFGIG